jgi:oligopeptide/dipeptide ABC transporter ATP-binding protein
VPVPDAVAERSRRRIILQGDIPNPSSPPPGCRFHTRCWLRERLGSPEICMSAEPPLSSPDPDRPEHLSACHFVSELTEMVEPGALLPTETAVH